eukprot:jgi/Psemu1/18734/gm1.18734_g
MGRYHFLDEEDDDDDETDHHRHPIIPQTSRSHGSREEGEIIEDDSDEYENRDRNNNYEHEHEHENENEDYGDMDIDEDDERKDEYKYKYKYNSPQSNKYDIDGYEDTNHEDYDDDDDDGEEYRGRRPLSSYLPSFSGLTGRGSSDQSRYGGRNRSPSPSPSPGPSSHRYYYNEHRNKENVDNESSSGSSDDEPWKHTRTHLYPEHNGNGNMNSNSNSNRKAYRLIGSSKYDRNYDHEDFYSPNHSSSPVSDDERETTPGRNLSSTALVHRSKQQQQQQLSSPQPQPSSSTRPEIHYHIYVSENQASRWFPSQQEPVEEGEEATTAHHRHRHHSPVQLWKKLTLLAGATQLLWMVLLLTGFGGPLESLLIHTNTITPPPPYLTWDEYGRQQWNLARRVSSEGYALGRHLLRTASLRDGEDTEASDGNDRPTYRFPETWGLTSSLSSLSSSSLSTSSDNQNHNSSDNDNNSDSNSIPLAPTALHWLPGQDRAVRQLQPRLNAWSSYGRQQPQPSRIPTQVPPRRGSFPRHPTSSRVPLYSSYSSHSHSATPSAAPSSSASSSSSSISSSSSPRSPLVIYASGGKGVGKRSLAYLLLQQLETSTTGAGTGAGANTNRKSAWEACKDVWSHQSRDEEDNNTPEGFRAQQQQQQQQEQQQQRSYCPLLHLTPSDYHDSSTGEYGNGYDSDYSQTVADGINNNGDGDGDSDGNASVSSPLYRKILDHVVTAGGGASIVLLERVDCIVGVGAASGAVGASSFPEDCPHGGSATNPHQRGDWLSDLTALLKSQPAVFGNTIVVITSRVGTATAEKWTRKRLQQQQQQQSTRAPSQSKSQSSHHDAGDESWLADEVRSLVKYELRRYHSTDENDDDETRRLDDWWVLPLAPIERDGMGATLDRMAASGGCGEDSIAGFAVASASASDAHRHHDANDNKNSGDDETADADDATTDSDTDTLVPEGGFLLTRRASDAILDRLEWHQWIHKSTGAVLRVWSPDGADSLKDLWKHRILPRLSNALVSGCGAPPGDANQNEQNENEHENEHEQNEKGDVYDDDKKQRRLLLDADEESSHTTDRWVLRSCVVASTTAGEDEDNAQQQDSEGSSFVTTTDGRRWNCQTNGSEWNEHACRFYL